MADVLSLEEVPEITTRSWIDEAGQRVTKTFKKPLIFQVWHMARHAIDDMNNIRMGLTSKCVCFTLPSMSPLPFLYSLETINASEHCDHVGSLSIETSWHTKSWVQRTLAFFVAVAEANAYNALRYFNQEAAADVSHSQFRRRLALELMNAANEKPELTRKPFKSGSHYRIRAEAGANINNRCKCCPKQSKGRQHRTAYYCSCSPLKWMCRICYKKHCENS